MTYTTRRSDPVLNNSFVNNYTLTKTTMESSCAPIAQGETSPAVVKPRRRRRHRMLRPQPGSIYDILHDHAGLQLHVRPLGWTDLHAKLLNCRFVQLPPHDTPSPPSSLSSSSPSFSSSPSLSPPQTPPAVSSIGKTLDLLMSPDKPELPKTRALGKLLADFYPKTLLYPLEQIDMDLRVGSRHYPLAVSCQLLFSPIYPNIDFASFDSITTLTSASNTPGTTIEPSMMAYVSRSHLDHTRRTCFKILSGPKGTFNEPVHRLQVLRVKHILPKNPNEDSYFLAVMLAMAQKSVYPNIRSNAGFIPRNVKVHLLTIAEDENAFIVYTATVPAAVLSMFHDPIKSPKGSSEIKVEYTQVPAWPVLGLKERLAKALSSEIVGDFDPTIMDSYEDDAVGTKQPIAVTNPSLCRSNSSKRKRWVFSEVLNTSFSEDREPNHPNGADKKRRIQEGVSVVQSLSRAQSPQKHS
ncbi:hypothetical protein F5Y03DRAFT_387983 [Xylaria venustula]|nr:hypothetical protein F5Y03DRAFT_387983 [Xylaria venustula]